jgi:ABC-type nitrate/sulfonate/bicarbonate transport system permease component
MLAERRRVHTSAWVVLAGVTVALLGAALALGLPASARGWIVAEWSSALAHLEASGLRLGWALAGALVVAGPVAVAMRRSRTVETALTPWLLVALAIPWVLIAVALNMMVHLRFGSDGATWLAAAGGAAWLLGALGPRQQTPGARATRIRTAARTVLAMLLAAELLGLSQGVGTQIRFYVLYWSPPHLLLYGALTGLLLITAVAAGRLSSRPLIRATARLAGPRG